MNLKYLKFLTLLLLFIISCNNEDDNNNTDDDDILNDTTLVIDVEKANFTTSGVTITEIDCTLSDGTETKCYQITTTSLATDHDMGPWCPSTITDSDEAGGIWLDNGEVYNVDGEFIKNLAEFYGDSNWKMYDEDGNVYVTDTQEKCEGAARPDVDVDLYGNSCVECLASYYTNLSQTWVIPITPVAQTSPISFGGGGGPMNGAPSTRGIALNGIEFSASAPVDDILSAYTIAPFDDAGGHINEHQGYHYHAATEGIEARHTIAQDDEHTDLIGYAMDGFPIYASDWSNGNEPTDLDECRGHYDDVRGYHYHVDYAGENNFIDCLKGAYVADY